MRLPNSAHESRPWRIREIASDFRLEDVWELPIRGDRDDVQAAIDLATSFDPANADSLPTRALWRFRDRLGAWFGLGEIAAPVEAGQSEFDGALEIPETAERSLRERLPADLRGTADDTRFEHLPFVSLYRAEVGEDAEFAAEISNRTVHAVMHLGWVRGDDGGYRAQMAVYVKPRGGFGRAYMALIKPFRYWVVYPALIRQIGRAWEGRRPSPR